MLIFIPRGTNEPPPKLRDMKKGTLVFNEKNGRGIIIKKSPSGSLVEVNFKHHGPTVVLSTTLTEVK